MYNMPHLQRPSFLLGSVPLGPTFTGMGVISCQNFDTIQ